jgi:chloramphenicol 3-O phosphotransferase
VDDLVDALPPSLVDGPAEGIDIGDQGEVSVGPGFREMEAAWMAGLAGMARAGAGVIIDDVFLGGGESQARTRAHLSGLAVLWVGVRCDAPVAAAREQARRDRAAGMAELQATMVHEGVDYDLAVDTSSLSSMDCARLIAECVK